MADSIAQDDFPGQLFIFQYLIEGQGEFALRHAVLAPSKFFINRKVGVAHFSTLSGSVLLTDKILAQM